MCRSGSLGVWDRVLAVDLCWVLSGPCSGSGYFLVLHIGVGDGSFASARSRFSVTLNDTLDLNESSVWVFEAK